MTKDYKKLAIEAFKLNLKIKQNILELKRMKRELREKMVDAGTKKILLDEGEINAFKWKSSFSPLIRKEFNKLDDKKKHELYKTGLLKIQFRLDSKKFQELKDKKEKSELDEYVIERKNIVFLRFQLNKKTREMLKEKEEGRSIKDTELEEDDWDDYLFEIEADERDYWSEMEQEMRPDPVYFTDDDPADVSGTEEEYIGTDRIEDEDDEDDEDDKEEEDDKPF